MKDKKHLHDFKKRFFISLGLTIPIIILSPLIQDILDYSLEFSGDYFLLFILSSMVFAYGGWPFLKGMVKEVKNKSPGMMLLIGLAVIVSYSYSSMVVFGLPGRFFFWELSTLIVVMLLGHWIEMRSVKSASRALEELAKLVPKKAHLIKDDKVTDVSVSELKKNDLILVKPGERVPVDGIIVKGITSINEAMLTGESKPVSKSKDDEVIGGSINQDGSIRVKVTKTGEESYISQVINLVKKAQKSKSKTQNLANKAALWLTIIAVSLGAVTFSVWSFLLRDLVFSLERAVTVMVIACPHALGLAIPLVIAVTTSLSAKKGLLIKNRTAFEQARKIGTIVFDKTGTLTKGEFGVSNISTLENRKPDEVLMFAASVESNSEHSIAKGIVKEAEKKNIKIKEISGFKSIPGRGVLASISGKKVMVIGENYIKEKEIEVNEELKNSKDEAGTTVYVMVDDEVIGSITLTDIIRESAEKAVKELKELGLKCLMITGDNKKVAEWVSRKLGLDDYYAHVLPDKKSGIIKELQSEGMVVGMVGDGVNDAPALTQADVGIAIGAGTDVALESADLVLVKNNPEDVALSIRISKATYNKMKQNLFWAAGYNVVALPLAAGVLYDLGIILSPAVGAFLMSLSTIIVAVNSKFLKLKE